MVNVLRDLASDVNTGIGDDLLQSVSEFDLFELDVEVQIKPVLEKGVFVFQDCALRRIWCLYRDVLLHLGHGSSGEALQDVHSLVEIDELEPGDDV